MKKIKYNICLLVLASVIGFWSCTSNSSSEKKSSTNEEKSDGDATCAYCGKRYFNKNGYLGQKEGMVGKASDAGRNGSYCSESCAWKSIK